MRDIIVVGACTGGTLALEQLAASFPPDLQASVFVAMHIPTFSESNLPDILSEAGPLNCIHPVDGQKMEKGIIYCAPTDHHLLLDGEMIRVRRGPRENQFRPSIDPLFRSAAYSFRERVIGILLSGFLDDGVSGLYTIKQLGGKTIIQSPDEAEQDQLLQNALVYVDVDHVIDTAQMGPVLTGMLQDHPTKAGHLPVEAMERLVTELDIAGRDSAFELGILDMGTCTAFTCSECNGALVRLTEGKIVRFRCHTGHAYTASALLSEVTASIEKTLWQAMRGMEEMNMLMKTIADNFEQMEDPEASKLFQQKAQEGLERSREVREVILKQFHYSEDLRYSGRQDVDVAFRITRKATPGRSDPGNKG